MAVAVFDDRERCERFRARCRSERLTVLDLAPGAAYMLDLLIAEDLPRDLLIAHDDYADKFDPHVWMDVQGWMKAVAVVRHALASFDPASVSTGRRTIQLCTVKT